MSVGQLIIEGQGRFLKQRVDRCGADQPRASLAGGDGGGVGVTYTYPNLRRDDLALHEFVGAIEHHFLHYDPGFLVAVVAGEDLGEGHRMGLGSVVLDVLHLAAFPAPRMVDQELRVLAEGLVHELLRGLRYTTHCTDSKLGQPIHCSGGDLPEVRQRFVVPQRLPVQVFIEVAHMVFRMLGRDVQSDLGEVQVCTDARCRRDLQLVRDLVHQRFRQQLRCHVVGTEVVGYVEEALIDAVHVDVVR